MLRKKINVHLRGGHCFSYTVTQSDLRYNTTVVCRWLFSHWWLSQLRLLLDLLIKISPLYGYFPEPCKSCLTVKRSLDHDLFSLPVCHGGLGIRNPTTTADSLYNTSRCATQLLTNAIKGLGMYFLWLLWFNSQEHFNLQKDFYSQVYNTIFKQSNPMIQRSLTRNKQSLLAWPTALPIQKDDFNLSAFEFRDALCVRYMKPLLQLPQWMWFSFHYYSCTRLQKERPSHTSSSRN